MKPSDFLIRAAVLLALPGGYLLPSLRASVAVVSNLEAAGESFAVFRDFHGMPLAAGCQVQLVTFGDLPASEIAALAAVGPGELLAQATPFGAAATVGTGSGQPGTVEFEATAPLSASLGGLHAIVLNAGTPAAATEVLVVSLPGELQADSLSGLEGHLAVHFDQATLVFGSRTAAGFATSPSPAVVVSPFDAWISAQLGEGALPGDLLADADPDHDGRANLLEYATGTLPGDAAQVECLKLQLNPAGATQVIYLRRTGDEGILSRIDYREVLGEGDWSELTSAITTPAEVPFPAPDGCEWVRQALPAGNRGFVRLRVEMAP